MHLYRQEVEKVTLRLIDCEALRLEAKLAALMEEIDLLRTILRARKVAGLLQPDDLARFMRVDAEIECATAALWARIKPSRDIPATASTRRSFS